MVRHIPNRTTIKEFKEEIDEARFVGQYNFFHQLMRFFLCLALMNLLYSVARPGDHGDINTALSR